MSEAAIPEIADFSSIEPEQFAALMSQADDAMIDQIVASEHREKIFEEIFNRMADHMDPVKAGATEAIVHWKIAGAADGGTSDFQTIIKGGTAEVSRELDQTPRVTLKVQPAAFLKLVAGRETGPTLFMSGKLSIEGDLAFAAGMTSLFVIPTAG